MTTRTTGFEVRDVHGFPILTRATRKAAKRAAREWVAEYAPRAMVRGPFTLVELIERERGTFDPFSKG